MVDEYEQWRGWGPGEWNEIAKKESEAFFAKLARQAEGGGVVTFFATRLHIFLETMDIEDAFEAAQHATRRYIQSNAANKRRLS